MAKPPPRFSPRKQPNSAQRFLKANSLLLVAVFVLLGIALWFFPWGNDKEDWENSEVSATEVMIPIKEKSRNTKVVSKHVGKIKRRASTRAEKRNTKKEPLSEEFVEEHVDRLKKVASVQIRGAEMSIPLEQDPRKRREMELRLEAARRFKRKLESVNPRDRSTWFFADKPGENDETVTDNNFFPVPKRQK